jgi:hypothetical protein
MKKIIPLMMVLLLCMHDHAKAQPAITAAEYYIDIDPGRGNGTTISLTGLPNLSFTYDFSAIAPGVHRVGVRTKDANGGWSLDAFWLFVKPYPLISSPADGPIPPITAAEYYLDNDPGRGNGTPISLAGLPNLGFTYDFSAIAPGVHRVGVRTKDANGGWSLDANWLFVKPYPLVSSPVDGPIPAVTRAEYFVDIDPGYGNGTAISLTGLPNLSFTYDFTSASSGVHRIGVRSKDANGGWSLDGLWLFVKPYPPTSSPSLGPIPKIVAIEYYIDVDPGKGQATPVAFSAGQDISALTILTNATGLTNAAHKMGVRTKDENGVWSLDALYDFTLSGAVAAPTIYINNLVNKPSFCAKDTLNFSYDAKGTFNTGNVFTAQLSDAAGSFASPIVLGSFTGTTNSVMKFPLPAHLPSGNGYKIRVNASNTAVTGVASTASLNIYDRPNAQTITGLTNVNGTYTWPYSITNVATSTYNWVTTGGTFTPGSPTSTGTMAWAQPSGTSSNETLKLIETNQFGCSGDTSLLNVVVYKLRTDNTVSALTPCKGDAVTLNFTVDGAIDAGNVYTAQLSDASGSFATPTAIGTLTANGIGVNQSGSIAATIPANIPNGASYRIRVVSSAPVFNGNANSSNIDIQKPNLGADVEVYLDCVGDVANISNTFNTTGLTISWDSPLINIAPVGTYRLIATNTNGCSDTAFVFVKLEVARWTGAISNDWHVAGNWNINKVPTIKTHVIVPGGTANPCVVSNANGLAASVQVRTGGSVTTNSGRIVDVKGKCLTLPAN